MSEKYRRCDKCGDSASQNPALILHTFPRAGKAANLTRVRLWAQYCFPSKSFTEEQLKAMHRSHMTLCNKHFDRSAYTDDSMTRLNTNALPGKLLTASPVPGPSHQSECLEASSLDPSSTPDSNRPESLPANQNNEDNRNKDKMENVETNADDNFYTMDEDGVQDDLVDGDEINLESETQHDDVEFIDELRLDKDPETLKHSDFKCNVCRGEIVGFRHVCVQCVDWDMCASCEARGEHPEHYVLRLPAPKPYVECEPVIAAIREQIEHLLLLRNEIKSEADAELEAYFEEEPNIDVITEDFDPNLTDPISATIIKKEQSDTVADIEAHISDTGVTDRPQTRPILILAKPTLAQGVDRSVPELNISKKQSDIVANIPEVNTHLVIDRPKAGHKLIIIKSKLAPGVDRNVPELNMSKKQSDVVANIPEDNTHPASDRPHTAPKLILTKSTGLAPGIRTTAGAAKRFYIINPQEGSQMKKVKES